MLQFQNKLESSLNSRVFRRKKFPASAFKEHTYHPYNIYPILYYPPLILSRSLRSLAKQTSPIFNCVTPVSVSLATLARQLSHFSFWVHKVFIQRTNQYFNRISLLWNTFSPINLSLSFTSIKRSLKQKFWNLFYCTL